MPDSLTTTPVEHLADCADQADACAGYVRDAIDTMATLLTWDRDAQAAVSGIIGSLAQIHRRATVYAVMRRAGLRPDAPIPDAAEPKLQGLIRARSDLPPTTYDQYYRVVVRNGVAYVVMVPGCREFDNDYWEPVAGCERAQVAAE